MTVGRRQVGAAESRTLALADGSVVGCHQAGDPAGTPLLWCHGGLSSSAEVAAFDRAARTLGVRVVALDRPGIGDSSSSPVTTVAEWAAVAGECAERLGLPRFAVAGWSAGGPYALACALALGDRVSAVTTVAGMVPVADPHRRRELGVLADRLLIPLSRRAPGLVAAPLSVFRLLPEPLLWQVVRASAPPAERRDLAPALRPVVTGMLQHAVRHGTAGLVADYRRFGGDWGFAPTDVTAPVTVLQGADDGMLPPAHAERLAEALPHADLRMVAGASHFLPLVQPELVLRIACPR